MNIAIINGPNLNKLGTRENAIYGKDTLQDITTLLEKESKKYKINLIFKQSNHEGELIDFIQSLDQDQLDKKTDFIIFNPAAYTHTSIALRDALLAVDIPFIEIHISNVYQRENFRQHSYFSDIAEGVICGLGITGYKLALEYIAQKLKK